MQRLHLFLKKVDWYNCPMVALVAYHGVLVGISHGMSAFEISIRVLLAATFTFYAVKFVDTLFTHTFTVSIIHCGDKRMTS